MILKLPKETDEALQQWIHNEYGRDSSLLREDYYVSVDPELDHDVFIGCGSTIQIIVKFPPGHPKFYSCLKSVFRYPELRALKRSKALVKKSDAERWYSLALSNMDKPLPVLKRGETFIGSVRTRLLTQLEVTDQKTGRIVTVTIENGNAFAAQDKAIKILFGERA